MISRKLKAIARENRWYRSNHEVFGLRSGYLFKLSDVHRSKDLLAEFDSIPKDVQKRLTAALESQKKTYGFTSHAVGEDGVFLEFPGSFGRPSRENLYGAMDYLAARFDELGISRTDCCGSCRSRDNLGYYASTWDVHLLCRKCFVSLQSDMGQTNAQYAAEEKHYFRGAVGAALFSLVGVIAWVLAAYYSYDRYRLIAVMAFFFAPLALKGYDFAKARRGKFTPLFPLLISLGAIVLANYAAIWFSFMMDGAHWGEALRLTMSDPAVIGVLQKDLLLSFILYGFGVLSVIFILWHEGKQLSVKPAQLIQ